MRGIFCFLVVVWILKRTRTRTDTHTNYDCPAAAFPLIWMSPLGAHDTVMCRQGFLSGSAGVDRAGLRLQIQHTLLYSPW